MKNYIALLALASSIASAEIPLNISASDPDGDALTITAEGLPPGLTATQSGDTLTIDGVPTAVGTFPVTIRATDGEAVAVDTFNWNITAEPAPEPPNQAPALGAIPDQSDQVPYEETDPEPDPEPVVTVSAVQPWPDNTDPLAASCGGQRHDVTTQAEIVAVPWDSLDDGDVVNIWPGTYRLTARMSEGGTESCPVIVHGVTVDGAAPLVTGEDAQPAADIAAEAWNTYVTYIEGRGVFILFRGLGDDYPGKPHNITFQNLRIAGANQEHSYTSVTGDIRPYYAIAAAVNAPSVGADYITIQNSEIFDNGNGLFSSSVGAVTSEQDSCAEVSQGWIVRNNSIHSNSNVDQDREHGVYLQGDDTLIEGNWFGPNKPGALGAVIKDRSSGTVIRGNTIYSGTRSIDLVEGEDSFGCFAKDLEKYDSALVEDNIIVNDWQAGSLTAYMVHWGGDNEKYDAGLSRPAYRSGTLTFRNNTVVVRMSRADTWRASLFDGYDTTVPNFPATDYLQNNVDVSNNTILVVGDVNFMWQRNSGRVTLGEGNRVFSQSLFADRADLEGSTPVAVVTGSVDRSPFSLVDPFNADLAARDYSER